MTLNCDKLSNMTSLKCQGINSDVMIDRLATFKVISRPTNQEGRLFLPLMYTTGCTFWTHNLCLGGHQSWQQVFLTGLQAKMG